MFPNVFSEILLLTKVKGTWSDDDLRVVLSHFADLENSLRLL